MNFTHVHAEKSRLGPQNYKIILAGLLFGTLILCWGGIVAFQRFSFKTESGIQDQFQNVALIKKEQLESFLRERVGDSEILSLRTAVLQSLEAKNNGFISSELHKRLDETLLETEKTYGYRRIVVFDNFLQARNANSQGELTSIVQMTLNTVLKTGMPELVDIHLANDGQAIFGVAHPVFSKGDPNLGIIGVVYLEMTVEEHLYPIIAKWSNQSTTAEAVLVRQEDNDALYLTPLLKQPRAGVLSVRRSLRNPDFLPAMALKSNQLTPLSGKDYAGTDVLGASIPIKYSPWYLIVKADRMEVLKPVRLFGLALIVVMLLLLMLLFMGAWLAWRKQKMTHDDAEKRLNTRYRAATQASMDAYVAYDNSGKIIDVNDAMVRLTGYSRDELLRQSISDINSALSADEVTREINKIRSNHADRLKTKWRCKNGSLLDVDISAVYLPDSGLETFHSYVRDISPEIQARHRIERLNNLYIFLSHANAAIFNAQNVDEIYQSVSQGALSDGKFILAWVGILDEEAGRVTPAYAYGAAAEYVKHIEITVDPSLPTSQGPTRRCMVDNKPIYTNDFQNDKMTSPWHDIGKRFNINSSIAIPINLDGNPVSALTFYSGEKNYFDYEFVGVLEEVAKNVSLALMAISAKKHKEWAEIARGESESRFRQIFEASPLPMQILSRTSRKLTAINMAHQKLFGYELSEIEDEVEWFGKVFPDKLLKEKIRDQWEADLQRIIANKTGVVVASPEISLRCKSGEDRIVRGYMSISGDIIIVQWHDLTEVKRNQSLLIENEYRFRSLIEQNIIGIYVQQDNKLVYVNPRMCEIIGWSAEEILGKDILEIYSHDSVNRVRVLAARSRLNAGERSVSLTLSAKRKDGMELDLLVHAALGNWNGKHAIIVMAQDVTEKLRDEEKITQYLKQLEGTMEGTLRAVAKMVDLRDPYTAGHEERVGIIAADIAREMGWPDDKCNNLRLIGLVHDIGKIGVPAELLSKPTRLTPLEYEMIQEHAEKGYEILKDVEFPLPIAEIIREHHERMDGSGYPHGLIGQQILPEARILAVADVLESMASHRPYRPALGIDVAIKEIEGHRGTWFDTAVVDALLRLVRERGYQLPDSQNLH